MTHSFSVGILLWIFRSTGIQEKWIFFVFWNSFIQSLQTHLLSFSSYSSALAEPSKAIRLFGHNNFNFCNRGKLQFLVTSVNCFRQRLLYLTVDEIILVQLDTRRTLSMQIVHLFGCNLIIDRLCTSPNIAKTRYILLHLGFICYWFNNDALAYKNCDNLLIPYVLRKD